MALNDINFLYSLRVARNGDVRSQVYRFWLLAAFRNLIRAKLDIPQFIAYHLCITYTRVPYEENGFLEFIFCSGGGNERSLKTGRLGTSP